VHILIIDDERHFRRHLAINLESMGHVVSATAGGESAIEELNRREFDLAMIDLHLGRENGLDLIPRVLRLANRPTIVVMTAHVSYETAVEAVHRGAFDYLPKPFTTDRLRSLLSKVARARRRWARQTESGAVPKGTLDLDLCTTSRCMQRAVQMALKAANSDATTLLLGETGTGKSSLARTIHLNSERATQPFITVSCPSLSPHLLESDLFGHVKGAFTGAHTDTWGKVTQAEGGTIFLDEIGDLTMPLQAKLLRLLQEHEYERVGETHSRQTNVRIIAATNRNLKDEVAENRFREDLYYRLTVLPITIPPLRERIGDLPGLVNKLLRFFAEQAEIEQPCLSPNALDLLGKYSWPGNLRELRNLLERAVILCSGTTIDSDDLAPHLAPRSEIHLGSRRTLAEIEAEHIRRIIATTSNLDEAATVLDINPATLYRKRKRLGTEHLHRD